MVNYKNNLSLRLKIQNVEDIIVIICVAFLGQARPKDVTSFVAVGDDNLPHLSKTSKLVITVGYRRNPYSTYECVY